MNITANDLQSYYDKLEHHDWTYQYSDDYSVWARGQSQFDTIRGLADKHPDFDQLFRAYSNHVWRGANKPEKPQ